MSFWTAVVLIVLIGSIASVFRSRASTSARSSQQNDRQALEDKQEAQREIEELRERVKVLERITVDGREARAIADEIDSLRGKPDKQDG